MGPAGDTKLIRQLSWVQEVSWLKRICRTLSLQYIDKMVNERLAKGVKMIRLNVWAVETNTNIKQFLKILIILK